MTKTEVTAMMLKMIPTTIPSREVVVDDRAAAMRLRNVMTRSVR